MDRVITMLTTIDRDSIRYEVVDGDPVGAEFTNARTVWSRDVPFMGTQEYRAGGWRFTDAAREQEETAMRLAQAHAALEEADSNAHT